MDPKIVQEILHELFTSLETLDTETSAIREFLKDKGIATDQELAPYLEQAGNASSVRWLAARVRIDHLLSSAMKPAGQDAKDAKKDSAQSDKNQSTENKNEKEAHAADKTEEEETREKDATGTSKVDKIAKSEVEQPGADLAKKRDEIENSSNQENASEKAA